MVAQIGASPYPTTYGLGQGVTLAGARQASDASASGLRGSSSLSGPTATVAFRSSNTVLVDSASLQAMSDAVAAAEESALIAQAKQNLKTGGAARTTQAFAVTDSYAKLIADYDALAYYRLDETGGYHEDVAAADKRGVSDGSYANTPKGGYAGPLDGVSADATHFDGYDDVVEIADAADFQLDNGTINLMFEVEDLGGTQTLISRDSSGYDGGGHLDIVVLDDGRLQVRLQSDRQSHYITTAHRVDEGQYHSLSFSFGDRGMQLHLDGELVGTNAYTGGITGNYNPFTVGASQMSSGNDVANNLNRHFDGKIAELAIFDQQLTTQELSALHQAAQSATILPVASGADLPDGIVSGRIDELLAATPDAAIAVDFTGELEAASGLALSAEGQITGEDGTAYDVFRVTNANNTAQTVTLIDPDGNERTLEVAAESDTFLAVAA